MFKTLSATAIGLVILLHRRSPTIKLTRRRRLRLLCRTIEKLFNAKDAHGLAALFADDAVQAAHRATADQPGRHRKALQDELRCRVH